MERSEPTFVPEWLKNTASLNTTSPHHSDEQGVPKTTRNKSFVNINDSDLGRPSVSEKTTSSYFRRTSSNGSSHLRSYSSFGRNNRDRDRDRDNKEKSDNNNHRHRDYSDPLSNILPSRFEKEGLRRSHSSVSSSKSWPRKVTTTSDKNHNNHNNNNHNSSSNHSNNGRGNIGNVKIAFERDFPSLGSEENGEVGRVPSPGLTTAIQSLPIGNAAVIGGDGWTSALAEVPVIVGTNGGVTPVQSSSTFSAPTNITTSGRNMAETLAQGPPRAQTAPQLSVGTQRLEELAVKQSRQLIPMTPSLPKALGSNLSDKPKAKVAQLQLQNSQRPVSSSSSTTKIEISKTSSSSSTSSNSSNVGKLHVLKLSRERNGVGPTPKDSLSPTAGGGGKLPNSPLAVPSVINGLRNNSSPVVFNTVEKRTSSQAQSRNDFFNLMRKKSLTNNAPTTPGGGGGVSEDGGQVEGSGGVQEKKVCNGDTNAADNNGSNNSILYSEEEEARFLRSLGWEDTTEEEEGLTEEEISSFYRDVSKYLNLQAASKILKGTQTKLLMPMGKNGEISSADSKLES